MLPDPVGVGSSGAVLGMLASWIVWILFRWFVYITSIHPFTHSPIIHLNLFFYLFVSVIYYFSFRSSFLSCCSHVIHIHTSIHSFMIILDPYLPLPLHAFPPSLLACTYSLSLSPSYIPYFYLPPTFLSFFVSLMCYLRVCV